MNRGVSAVIATIIMTIIVIATAALSYMYIAGYFGKSLQQIEIVNILKNEVFLRNLGTYTVPAESLKFYLEGTEVSCLGIKDIEPGRITSCRIYGCAPPGRRMLRVIGPSTALGIVDMPLAWCIDAKDYAVVENGKSYLVINGTVYSNDGSGPYKNKELIYQLDNLAPEIIYTDDNGYFEIKKEWNFSYLLPKTWWVISKDYTVDNKYVNMWPLGEYITQPPSRVRHEDVIEEIQLPTIVLHDWKKVVTYKDIVPLEITNDQIKLQFNYTIETNDDFSIPVGTEKIFYGSGYNRADLDVSCANTPFATCYTGNTAIQISTTINGQTYNEDELPGDSNKYINYNITFTNVGNSPAVVWPWLVLYYNDSGSWKFLHWHGESTKLVQAGESETWTTKLYLEWIKDGLKKLGEDENNLARDYKLNIYSIIAGWGTTFGSGSAYFRINIPTPPAPGGFTPAQHTTIYWDMTTNLEKNKKYGLTYNITFDRENNDVRILGTREFVEFVNVDNDVIKTLHSIAGMRFKGTDMAIITDFLVPSVDKDFYSYLLPIPTEVNDDTVRFLLKMYVLNPGDMQVNNVIVYPTRGDFKRNSTSVGEISDDVSLLLSLTENPKGNEIIRNMIKVFLRGWHLNMTYYVNEVKFEHHELGNDFNTLAIPGWASYEDVTDNVTNSPTPDILSGKLDIHPPTHNAYAYLDVWNWYMSQIPLWQNRGEHIVIFETTEPEPPLMGYYEYKFVT